MFIILSWLSQTADAIVCKSQYKGVQLTVDSLLRERVILCYHFVVYEVP